MGQRRLSRPLNSKRILSITLSLMEAIIADTTQLSEPHRVLANTSVVLMLAHRSRR